MRPTADLILTNGRIYTVDAAKPWASAVAIRNGRYIAIDDVDAVKSASTEVVDLKGRPASPCGP